MTDKPVAQAQRVVFFDLDGTLHQEDMFGSFLRFLLRHLPLNLVLVVPLLPIIGLGLLIGGWATRWPMSLLLWAMTFGRSEARLKALEAKFVDYFRRKVTAFPVVQMRLRQYLDAQDAQVWLITGSPERLVEQVYRDSAFLPRVRLGGEQHCASLRGLGVAHALPGSTKGGATGAASGSTIEIVQWLQRQQAG
ncbi:HAD hydrolase, family IF [Serratia fonticola]|uniref:HAD hydrolase, family IF n=1 Tax=Serratia fonticola TaxID=47917 RepID=A0A4U9UIJ9_SERFO|nr:HAD hydrolase, family IF [Serratia fonticola]